MLLKKKLFIISALLFFSINVSFANTNEQLYDQVPSRMLEVTKLKKVNNRNQNIYVLKYDCMCGVKAVEIIKRLKQIRIYSACVPFKEEENHVKYRIINVSKNGSVINFETERVENNFKKMFSFEKINEGVYYSNVMSERGGFESSEEIVTKYAFFIDASIRQKFQEVEEDCGDFDG